jgi:hypothetical protein
MDIHSSVAAVFGSCRHDSFNRKLAEEESPSNVTARAMGGNDDGIGKETTRNWMRQDPARVKKAECLIEEARPKAARCNRSSGFRPPQILDAFP